VHLISTNPLWHQLPRHVTEKSTHPLLCMTWSQNADNILLRWTLFLSFH